MGIVVRPVVETDLAVLRQREDRPGAELVDRHFEAAATGGLLFAAAFDGDAVLGTALLDLNAEAMTPELRNMFVFPEARRRGAGRALSRWIEDQARAAGFTAVYLAVDPNNERAVPLYISLEYHPTGEHLFVEQPEVVQVDDNDRVSSYYAIYKKSLTIR
ncbi:MAG: GNAT family N-acetyltransferase [Arachnia sp.]